VTASRAGVVLTLLTLAAACGDAADAPTPEREGESASSTADAMPGRIYEHGFVFMAEAGDSVLLVPWLMRTLATPDSTLRDARGWLGRAGAWEAFYGERWATPPTRTPGRILPHGDLSIVVRDGDLVDGLLFGDGPRNLEVAMGEVLAAWIGPTGETLDLMEGAAYLSDRRVDGLVVEMSRSWREAGPAAGDWLFVASGDSVRFVMIGDREHGLDEEPVYRGWAQRGQQDIFWPEVSLSWTARQSFPPARRDVPTEWTISSEDGSVSGTLTSRTSAIEAGDGEGPLLPVLALVEVEGTISADGARFPVRGLLVHQRR